MSTSDDSGAAQRAAEQLAGVVIAALRPDMASTDGRSGTRFIGHAVQRLGGELHLLLRELESETAEASRDSAIARAAHLAAHITLSDQPDVAVGEETRVGSAPPTLSQGNTDREL